MATGEKIKALRKKLGMTADQLGELIGRDRASVYRYEYGDIEKVPTTIIAPLAKALKVSPSYLLDVDASPSHPNLFELAKSHLRPIPIYSAISCGTGKWVDELPEDMVGVPSSWTSLNDDYFGNEAGGDSMEPDICEGDCLIFKRSDSLMPGQIGAFSLNGEYFCKRLKKKADTFFLESENPKYPDIPIEDGDDFRILGLYKFKLSREQ